MTFTPVHTFLGGYLLHLASSSLLEDNGRVFGISGILSGAIFGGPVPREGSGWRWAVLGGLLVGPLLGLLTGANKFFPGNALDSLSQVGLGRLIVAGGLVGFGSRLGSGCTSGHMLCGVSRLSPRSIVATITFFTTAVLTANLAPLPYSDPATSSKIFASAASPFTAHPASFAPSTLIALFSTIALAKLAQYALRRYLLSLKRQQPVARASPYFLDGVIFALGLAVSGMTDSRKVLGFLRFPQLFANRPQDFDPSLAMVMLGGLLPNMLHYAWITHVRAQQTDGSKADSKRLRPKYPWETWRVPTGSAIDWKLVLGSATFGVGWGSLGICPGPALVNLGEVISRWIPYTLSGPTEVWKGGIQHMGADEIQRQIMRIGAFIGSMLLGMAANQWD
ncbi:hypothetical protein IAU59_004688 [Kwoniella sp. CBS 9459]